MHTLYIDADACPVKAEAYKVAKRYAWPVVVVANSTMAIPTDPLISIVVRTGFGAADDYIAEVISLGDVCVTADVPLAARCVAVGAVALSPKGRIWSAETVGEALAARNLAEELRQSGLAPPGPSPMLPKDRSRFLASLDTLMNAAIRAYPVVKE